MKKKLIASITCLSLLLVMLLSSTIAWFTDSAQSTNTMIVGNVKIEQLERYRDENNKLQPWHPMIGKEYNPPMFPVVPDPVNGLTDQILTINNVDYRLYDQNQNVVDKIVSVKNTGSDPAYIRTVFAFEMMKVVVTDAEGNESIHWENPIGTKVIVNDNANQKITFEDDDSTRNDDVVIYCHVDAGVATYNTDPTDAVAAFVVGISTYDAPLRAGDTSAPSLLQVYLHQDVGSDFYEAVDQKYSIMVVSQAVQVAGFGSADEALDRAFRPFNAVNAAEWFAGARYDAGEGISIKPELTTIDEIAMYEFAGAGNDTSPLKNVKMNIYSFDADDFQNQYPVDQYKDWTCDFFVSTNNAVDIKAPDKGLILVGNYDPFGWIGFWVPKSEQAYEPIGLLGAMTSSGDSNWPYEEICDVVKVFRCGLLDVGGLNAGTQVTVELRMTSPDGSQTITVTSITVTL